MTGFLMNKWVRGIANVAWAASGVVFVFNHWAGFGVLAIAALIVNLSDSATYFRRLEAANDARHRMRLRLIAARDYEGARADMTQQLRELGIDDQSIS